MLDKINNARFNLKTLTVTVLLFTFLAYMHLAFATATRTPASGGSSISADTTGVTYTTLTGPVIAEGATADIGTGTIILNAPSGFIFDTGGSAPTVLVTRTAGTGADTRNINNLASGASIATTRTASQITATITDVTSNAVRNSLTWQNVRVRPTAGTPLVSGNILKTGTSNIAGVTGATNLGTLTEVAGVKSQLVFSSQPSAIVMANTDFTTKPVVIVKDQYGNTVTSDNSSLISISAKLYDQTCTGSNGSGILTSTPNSGTAVSSGVKSYTAMQYSVAENIKICATSAGLTSALSDSISVQNPIPSTTSIDPSVKMIGDADFIITVNGSNFVSGSVIQLDGSNITATFVSPTILTATISIPAEDYLPESTHYHDITVFNAGPGGGTSNSQTFTVNNPTASIDTISPDSKMVGDSEFTMTVSGSGFMHDSIVRVDGLEITTIFVSPNEITAVMPVSHLASAGTHNITVYNQSPGGGISNSMPFTVNNPTPSINSISPDSKNLNDAEFTMTISGMNFVSDSVAQVNGSDRVTAFISSEELTAIILASDMTTGGNLNISVSTPSPGGGSSNIQNFTVFNPTPGSISISPSTKTRNDSEFTMTITGSDFVTTSVVHLNGVDKVTTFIDASHLTAVIPASDLTSAGNFSVLVHTHEPGGGESPTASFTVNNPVPVISSISPDSATVGDSEIIITVSGSDFTPDSTVEFDEVDQMSQHTPITTYISPTTLSARISMPSSDWTDQGPHNHNLFVYTPGPGGGNSNSKTFTVNNPTPGNISLSDYSKVVGEPEFTLTITGSSFMHDSEVLLDGTSKAATYISSTELTAIITNSDLASVGSKNISVYTPNPGGGSSDSRTLTVNNPTPVITSIDQTTKNVGDAGFTMTIIGTGFQASSVVQIEGVGRVTNYIDSNTLTAQILTSDLSSPGSFSISILNNAPGGGSSNSKILVVQRVVGWGGGRPEFVQLFEDPSKEIEKTQPSGIVTPSKAEETERGIIKISNPYLETIDCNILFCNLALRFDYPEGVSVEQVYMTNSSGDKVFDRAIKDDKGKYHFNLKYKQNSELKINICESYVGQKDTCTSVETWTLAFLNPSDVKFFTEKASHTDPAPYHLKLSIPSVSNLINSNSVVEVLKRPLGITLNDFDHYQHILKDSRDGAENYAIDLYGGDYLLRVTPFNARGARGVSIEKTFSLEIQYSSKLEAVQAVMEDLMLRFIKILEQMLQPKN
jgi:hypothetical protein